MAVREVPWNPSDPAGVRPPFNPGRPLPTGVWVPSPPTGAWPRPGTASRRRCARQGAASQSALGPMGRRAVWEAATGCAARSGSGRRSLRSQAQRRAGEAYPVPWRPAGRSLPRCQPAPAGRCCARIGRECRGRAGAGRSAAPMGRWSGPRADGAGRAARAGGSAPGSRELTGGGPGSHDLPGGGPGAAQDRAAPGAWPCERPPAPQAVAREATRGP